MDSYSNHLSGAADLTQEALQAAYDKLERGDPPRLDWQCGPMPLELYRAAKQWGYIDDRGCLTPQFWKDFETYATPPAEPDPNTDV